MALSKCRECGGQVSSDAQACPHCGAPKLRAVAPAGSSVSPWVIVIVVIVSLMGLGAIVGRNASDSAPSPDLMTRTNGKLDDTYALALALQIRGAGFVCPQVNGVRPLGVKAEGNTARVYCGTAAAPDRSSDEFTYWVVTDRSIVKKCSDEPRC